MPETIRQLAERFGRTPGTIRKWRKQGCDLTSEDSLQEYALRNRVNSLGRARNAVRNAAAQASATTPQGTATASAPSVPTRLPPASDEGAAAALKRLQGLEPVFYDRQLKALRTKKADLIAFALTDYNKICESLRRYEKEVEEAKRDLGHLIAKAEAQEGARAAAIWFRLAWRLFLSSSIPDLLPLADDPRAFKQKAESAFSEVLSVALRNAQHAKCSLPDWAMEVIAEEFHVS